MKKGMPSKVDKRADQGRVDGHPPQLADRGQPERPDRGAAGGHHAAAAHPAVPGAAPTRACKLGTHAVLCLAIFVCVLLAVPALPFTAPWVAYVKSVGSACSRMLQGTAVETRKAARGVGSGFDLNLRAQASPLDAECEAEGKVVCHQGHIKGQPGAPLCTPSSRHRRMVTYCASLRLGCP